MAKGKSKASSGTSRNQMTSRPQPNVQNFRNQQDNYDDLANEFVETEMGRQTMQWLAKQLQGADDGFQAKFYAKDDDGGINFSDAVTYFKTNGTWQEVVSDRGAVSQSTKSLDDVIDNIMRVKWKYRLYSIG